MRDRTKPSSVRPTARRRVPSVPGQFSSPFPIHLNTGLSWRNTQTQTATTKTPILVPFPHSSSTLTSETQRRLSWGRRPGFREEVLNPGSRWRTRAPSVPGCPRVLGFPSALCGQPGRHVWAPASLGSVLWCLPGVAASSSCPSQSLSRGLAETQPQARSFASARTRDGGRGERQGGAGAVLPRGETPAEGLMVESTTPDFISQAAARAAGSAMSL